jgi:hypothetical protein
MSKLVKTKYQANLKDFKRFGAFKGLVEKKNVVFKSLPVVSSQEFAFCVEAGYVTVSR